MATIILGKIRLFASAYAAIPKTLEQILWLLLNKGGALLVNAVNTNSSIQSLTSFGDKSLGASSSINLISRFFEL